MLVRRVIGVLVRVRGMLTLVAAQLTLGCASKQPHMHCATPVVDLRFVGIVTEDHTVGCIMEVVYHC